MSAHFVVSQDGSHWAFSYRGTSHGPYTTKDAALSAAIRNAQFAAEKGTLTEVLVRDSDMRMLTAWSCDTPAIA